MKPLPDPYPIEPLAKPPNCTIIVPGSKSITNRTLILAASDMRSHSHNGSLPSLPELKVMDKAAR